MDILFGVLIVIGIGVAGAFVVTGFLKASEGVMNALVLLEKTKTAAHRAEMQVLYLHARLKREGLDVGEVREDD